MNSRTSLYVSGIYYMISSIFFSNYGQFVGNSGLKRFYICQECVQWVKQEQSYQGSLYNMCWRIHEVVAEAIYMLHL